MRTQRTTVLAGIAALALLAGTSLVSAQEKPDQNATPQAKQPQAAQQMDKNAPAEKMGQSIQEQNKRPMAPKSAQMNNKNKAASENKATTRNRTAQSEQHKFSAKKHAMTRTERSKASRIAEERNRMGRQNTAEQRKHAGRQKTAQGKRNGMKGLQGNASGMNVQLSKSSGARSGRRCSMDAMRRASVTSTLT